MIKPGAIDNPISFIPFNLTIIGNLVQHLVVNYANADFITKKRAVSSMCANLFHLPAFLSFTIWLGGKMSTVNKKFLKATIIKLAAPHKRIALNTLPDFIHVNSF
ncbi:MAG: hypothetical protein CBC09_01340 [Cellvibrionales bacterium TMED49]|nr:hypothetical protein [Porticoccaceae bacterium]OUU39839.1 MAG: hypothetical protein CBC09_01340 [Cellvibrionales bacterium TMED49]|tara:strand:- start:537 stop:851 length:315 start_codon:yes stop_codon:yes gene_type:complete